jgi:hypothetical protein
VTLRVKVLKFSLFQRLPIDRVFINIDSGEDISVLVMDDIMGLSCQIMI